MIPFSKVVTRRASEILKNNSQPTTIYRVRGKSYEYAETSLWLFGPTSSFRHCVVGIVNNKVFESFIITIILVNSIALGLTDYSHIDRNPTSPNFGNPVTEGSWRNTISNQANNAFTYVFVVEMCLKIVAMGFFFGGGKPYVRDGWNVLDFVVIITSLIALLPSVPSITIFRAFRVLRPLRNVSALPGLRKLLQNLFKALPEITNLIFVLLFMFLLFSVLGLSLFMGTVDAVCRLTPFPVKTSWTRGLNYSEYRCLNSPNVDVPSSEFSTQRSSPWYFPQECYWPTDDSDQRPCTFPGTPGNHQCFRSEHYSTWCGSNWDALGNRRFIGETTVGVYGDYYFSRDHLMAWGSFNSNMDYGYTTFNNVFRAFVTVFESVTLENWSWIMYMHRDTNSPVIPAIFFIFFAMIGSHVGLNLLLAVLEESFRTSKENELQQPEHIRMAPLRLPSFSFSVSAGDLRITSEKDESDLLRFVSHPWFARIVTLVIFVNTGILASDHYPNTPLFLDNCDKANFACTMFFAFDMAVKIAALGIRNYSQDAFNLFDGFVVIMSVIELCANPPRFISGKSVQKKGLSAFRILRLLRIFKLAKQWKTMMDLFQKISKTISDMGNLLLLLSIFIYIAGLVGMQFFANRICFDSFGFRTRLDDPEWQNCRVSRANYNTMTWALFNTFNIMTAENWNNIMYDGWRATETGYSFVYFMLVVVLGQILAMDLFLAILLSNFASDEDSEPAPSYLSPGRILPDTRGMDKSNTVEDLECAVRAITSDPGAAKQQESTHSVFPLSAGKTLLVFGPGHPIRFGCAYIISHRFFDNAVLVLIVLSSICLAIEDPLLDPHSTFITNLETIDITLTFLFCLEMVMKIIAVGLAFHSRAYLRSSWNVLDFLVVFFSIFSLVPSNLKTGNLKALRSLRTFRAFRPLRMISRVPSLKKVVNSLFKALPGVGNVMSITLFLFFVFGIVCVNLFKGTMRNCELGAEYSPGVLYDPVSNNPNQYGVLLAYPRSWNTLELSEKNWFGPDSPFNMSTSEGNCSLVWPQRPCCNSWPQDLDQVPTSQMICECWGSEWVVWWGYWKFDNILDAMLSLFQISSTEGWVYLMLQSMDQNGIGMQPIRDNKPGVIWLYVVFILVVHYFSMNLVVGVILQNFEKEACEEEFLMLTEQQQIFVKTQKIVASLKPFKQRISPATKVRGFLFKIIEHSYFEMFIMGCILSNTITMATQHKTQSDGFTLFLSIADYWFCGIFTLEAALKLFVFQKKYFEESWNRFDFLIVLLTDVSLVVELSTGSSIGPIAQVVRSVRVGRILRLINGAESIHALLSTLVSTFISLANIGGLWLMIVFIFAVLGNQLYAKVALPSGYNSQLNYYYNFQTFSNSLVTLFSFSGGEYWDGFSLALASHTPGCVNDPPYDPQMCGFTPSVNLNPQNGCIPLNGCGNASAVFFMCTFYFIVVIVMLNLFIGVIINEFINQKPIGPINKNDFRNFSQHWSKFDQEASYFIFFQDLFSFLTAVPPPWRIDCRMSKKDFYLKAVLWKLKIYKGNKVHFYDVIHALSREIMLQKLDQLEEGKRDRNFEDAFAKVLQVHHRCSSKIQPEKICGVEIGIQENFQIQSIQCAWKEHR